MVMSDIDQMEQLMHDEYNKLYEKDKEDGKDLNKKAISRLK